MNFQTGDRVTFNISKDLERLDRVFFISYKENIFALPGDYKTQGYSVNFDSVDSRRVSGRMNVSWNEYWGGTRYSLRPGGTFRFNENFSLSPSYSYNHIELPTGIYDTHTVTTRVTYNFNDRWLTNSLVQYNSVSGRASVYARLRYVINEIDSTITGFSYDEGRGVLEKIKTLPTLNEGFDGESTTAEVQVHIEIRKALLRLYIAGPGHYVHHLVLDRPAHRLAIASGPVVEVVAIKERDGVGRRSES